MVGEDVRKEVWSRQVSRTLRLTLYNRRWGKISSEPGILVIFGHRIRYQNDVNPLLNKNKLFRKRLSKLGKRGNVGD